MSNITLTRGCAFAALALACVTAGTASAQYPDVQQEEALAQEAAGEKPGAGAPGQTGAGTTPAGKDRPSSQAFDIAMQRMHEEMAIDYSGDADVDFVRGMIPHHRGAVEMAKVLQQYGKNPELKKLADEIIAAQQREIEFMEQWLERNARK